MGVLISPNQEEELTGDREGWARKQTPQKKKEGHAAESRLEMTFSKLKQSTGGILRDELMMCIKAEIYYCALCRKLLAAALIYSSQETSGTINMEITAGEAEPGSEDQLIMEPLD